MSAASNREVRRPTAQRGGVSPHAPSITVPLQFVVTGLMSLGVGIVCLVVRPDILAAYHYNQYAVSVTHLFVLGWICTLVMGAMYQLVPVALETKLYSEPLARWQFLLHLVGFVGMVWMFWGWNLKHVGHFGSVFTAGVVLFSYNIVRTLFRVPRWNVVATTVTWALVWLALGVLAGLIIAAAKSSYESESLTQLAAPVAMLVRGTKALAVYVARFDPMGAMHAHAHLGTVGMFIMLIVGISYKLVPMFTLSEVQSVRRARFSIAMLSAGLLATFVCILVRSPLKFLSALMIVAALGVYGAEMAAILRARKRRALDWGLKMFLAALSMLIPLSALGLVLCWPGLPLNALTGQLENLYGFLGILGVVSLAIMGMVYKILPFLVWYRSYSSRIGLAKVPSLADLYSTPLQIAGLWTYLAGLTTTGVGIVVGRAELVRPGCVGLALSLLLLAVNVMLMLRHLVRPRLAAPQGHASAALKPPRAIGTALAAK
jgi:hypothetical protein